MSHGRGAWALRHPLAAAGRLGRRLERTHQLPVGRVARARGLLRKALPDRRRVLVIGPPHMVRQALPHAALHVVGTNPSDIGVTVVSEALGRGSLPRRWDCVVVTEDDPPRDRLVSATDACLTNGVVVVVATAHIPSVPPGTELQHRARSRDVHLVVGRVTR
jgi:hypothetical protein